MGDFSEGFVSIAVLLLEYILSTRRISGAVKLKVL
tara:strand:+ start:774 stop:878 length:105 start_codon:yes stop_codon:yes gene_type:complete